MCVFAAATTKVREPNRDAFAREAARATAKTGALEMKDMASYGRTVESNRLLSCCSKIFDKVFGEGNLRM